MRKKLKSTGGFSLVEMLCAVAILVLLCLMMSTGLGMAVKSYQDVVAETESELLLSSLSDALADKLRYAVVTEKTSTNVFGEKTVTGRKIFISKDNDENTIHITTGAVAKSAVGVNPEHQVEVDGKPLLPGGDGGAYGKGRYKVTEATVTCDCGAPGPGAAPVFPVFTVKLKVEETPGGIGAETTLTVRCLNPVKEEAP